MKAAPPPILPDDCSHLIVFLFSAAENVTFEFVGRGWCRGDTNDGQINGRVIVGFAKEDDCRVACATLDMCEGFAWGPDLGRCFLYGPGLDHRLCPFTESPPDMEWQGVSEP